MPAQLCPDDRRRPSFSSSRSRHFIQRADLRLRTGGGGSGRGTGIGGGGSSIGGGREGSGGGSGGVPGGGTGCGPWARIAAA